MTKANSNVQTQTVDAFAPLLLRDALLANILTDDYANITYWAGKELARQFPVETSADLPHFFKKAAFGNLTIKYQGPDQQQWLLDGPIVAARLATNRQADFSLETGFLAQQLEIQSEFVAEGTFQVSARQQTVTITILADMSHKISSLTSSEQVSLRERFLDQAEEIAVQDVDENPNFAATTATTSVSEAAEAVTRQTSQATSQAAEPAESTTEFDFDEPAESIVADSLSVDQSITNSLLAFGKNRKNSTKNDQHSSLNQ